MAKKKYPLYYWRPQMMHKSNIFSNWPITNGKSQSTVLPEAPVLPDTAMKNPVIRTTLSLPFPHHLPFLGVTQQKICQFVWHRRWRYIEVCSVYKQTSEEPGGESEMVIEPPYHSHSYPLNPKPLPCPIP